jgi:hypothetical protein
MPISQVKQLKESQRCAYNLSLTVQPSKEETKVFSIG